MSGSADPQSTLTTATPQSGQANGTCARAARVVGYLGLAYLAAVALATVVGELVPQFDSLRGTAYALGRAPTILLVLGGLLVLTTLLDPTRDPRGWPAVALARRCPVAVLAAGYGLVMSFVTVRKHYWLDSHGCDLGIFENVLWNTLHGKVLYSSILGRHFFGEHVSPILLLLAPVYALWQDPRLLLILQSVALGLGALPIYWLAARRLGPAVGTVFALTYLVYKPLHRVNLFDFHPVALAVPLLLFALYYLEQNRRALFVVALVLAAACKEEICLLVSFFGVYVALKGSRRFGLVLVLSGLLLFLVEVLFVVSWYRGEPLPYVDRYSHLGGNLLEVLSSVVTRPLFVLKTTLTGPKIAYLVALFGPLAFLSLAGGSVLILAVPTLARILLSNQPAQYSLDFHFPAPVIPVLFVAAIFGVDRLSGMLAQRAWKLPAVRLTPSRSLSWRLAVPATRSGAARVLGVLVIICGFASSWTPFRALRDLPHDTGPATLRSLVEQIPPEASLAAHNTLAAHVARRRRVRVFPDGDGTEFVLLRYRPFDVEYPQSRDEDRRWLLSLLERGDYGPLAADNGFVLLKKGSPASGHQTLGLLKTVILDYEAEELRSLTGQVVVDANASRGKARIGIKERDPRGLLVRGPRLLFPPGKYRASFLLKTDPSATGTVGDVRVEPFMAASRGLGPLGTRPIRADVIGPDGHYRRVDLAFENPDYDVLDFEVWFGGESSLWVDRIEVEPVFPPEEFVRRLASY